MEHDQAALRITEWVQGRLAAEDAAEVAAHVRTCESCREVAAAVRGVTAAVAEHGDHLFSPHLAPEQLARYALAPDTLPLHELAGVQGHASACPSCAHELALARAAAAPSLVRSLRAWWPARAAGGRWLEPALAILAVLLVVPAYRGLVELPRERARALDAERRLGAEEHPAPPAPSWAGGASDVLILAGPTRGSAVVPEVRIRPGQPAQAILVDAPLPAADSLAIRLVEVGGRMAWRATVARADVWDASHRVASLLVPAAALTPGEYRLEIAAAAAGAPAFSARFRARTSP